jgi:hypothetical protein
MLPGVTFIRGSVTSGNVDGRMSREIRIYTRDAVHPRYAMDYRAFKEQFGSEGEPELHTLEKYYAVRSLIRRGCSEVYIDATLEGPAMSVDVDVAGNCHGTRFIVFCEVDEPSEELFSGLRFVSDLADGMVTIIFPSQTDTGALTERFPRQFLSGQFTVEQLSWVGREFDALEEALSLVAFLGNRTRVRMLLPLLRHPGRKRHFRTQINPKLVYENLSTLKARKLIDELSEDQYALTSIGSQIFGEYLTFVQKVRRLLGEYDE